MKTLHNTDFYAWTKEQGALLHAGRAEALDYDNLADEIEAMGASERNELESRLQLLLMHLLKWRFQPGHRGTSWRLTIKEQRRKIARRLAKSPSLRHEWSEILADAYGDAILGAARETGIEEGEFPMTCPWDRETILRDDFLPETTP